jgi:hypothetical protein
MIEEAAQYISAILEAAGNSQRAADIAAAKRLLAKHGITVEVE